MTFDDRRASTLVEAFLHQREDYRRFIERLDFEALQVEANRQRLNSKWRAYECVMLAERKGWLDEPPTCWERIMGQDWC